MEWFRIIIYIFKLRKWIFSDSYSFWNDFESSSTFSSCVNEFFPILIVFRPFNPSIRNVFTDLKLKSPISSSSKELRLHRQYISLLLKVRLPRLTDCSFGRSNRSIVQYHQKYLESQRNYQGNCKNYFQLYQFE